MRALFLARTSVNTPSTAASLQRYLLDLTRGENGMHFSSVQLPKTQARSLHQLPPFESPHSASPHQISFAGGRMTVLLQFALSRFTQKW